MSSVAVLSYDCISDCFYCGNNSGSGMRGAPALDAEDLSWFAGVSDELSKTAQGITSGFSREMYLTGGEATLPGNLPALKAGIAECGARSLEPNVNSNAWFAASPEAAGKMIDLLGPSASWNISTGEGHLARVPAGNIANFFSALAERDGRESGITALSTKDLYADQVLALVCAAAPAGYSLNLKENGLIVKTPAGRTASYRACESVAGRFGRGEGNPSLFEIESEYCGKGPLLSPDRLEPGLLHIYPCCKFPGDFLENRALTFRRDRYPDAWQVLAALAADRISERLRVVGKENTATRLRGEGLDVPYFTSVCGLCRYLKADVSSDPESRRKLEQFLDK